MSNAAVSNLAVVLSATTEPMVQDMKIAERALHSFTAAGEKMGTSLLKLTAQGAAFGLGFMGISHIMHSLEHGLEIVEQNEKAAVSFNVLLGSAKAAKDMLKELKQFSSESGMRFADARAGAAGLLKFGFNKEDVQPMLKTIGDFSTISMDGQAESMQRIIQLFGVIKDQGSLTARNMKALAAEGVEPWKALGEQLGVTRQELKRLLEAGELDSATALFAIQGAMKDKSFGGMNEDAKRMSRSLEDMKKAADGFWADLVGWGVEFLHVDEFMQNTAKGMKKLREEAKGIYGHGEVLEFRKELDAFFKSGGLRDAMSQDLAATTSTDNPGEKWQARGPAMQEENLAEIKHLNAEMQFLIALDESDLRIQEQLVAQGKLKAQQAVHAKEQMEDYIAQLQVARDTFGMSEHDKKMAKFAKSSPGDPQLQQIAALIEENKVLDEKKKLMEEGQRISDLYRTDEEKLADEVAKLTKHVNAGSISWGTYLVAMEKANKPLQDQLEKTKALRDETEKLLVGEEALAVEAMRKAGATPADIEARRNAYKENDQAKDVNRLRKEANELMDDGLTKREKMTMEAEKLKELYLLGGDKGLNETEYVTLMKRLQDKYKSPVEDVHFAGAMDSGSREAYSAIVSAQASMRPNAVAQQSLDQEIQQTLTQKELLKKQVNPQDLMAELRRINAMRVMTLGGWFT